MAVEEKGQVLPLVALVMAVVGLACLWLGRLGGAAVARAQARTAADAAALAGAVDGREAAVAAAGWNGGRLVSYEELGPDTRVRVELGGARATARARWLPGAVGADSSRGLSAFVESHAHLSGVKLHRRDVRPGGGDARGLTPAMREALGRAGQLLGTAVPVTSGYRSPAEQARLYARRHSNPYPVAPPGRSRHQMGVAVDVPLSFVPRLLSVAGRAGLCQPFPRSDPVHFELCARGVP